MKKLREDYLEEWLKAYYGKPAEEDSIILPVISGSMEPVLEIGSKIKFMCISWKQCRNGDIIVFKDKKGLIAHRLLFRLCFLSKGFFFQKGDVDRFGRWIRAESVVGVVVEKFSTDGKWINFKNSDEKKKAKRMAYKNLMAEVRSRVLKFLKDILKTTVKVN
jgi:hypothetical protein